ncbi:MAG: hypothetical protein K2P81_16805 [Bacteriovoracaceae bacterium]|nr:hypothetical protein [Bacteriovoracaceae bacterium]
MSDIMAHIHSVFKKYLSSLGEGGTIGNLDWDSMQWSSFLIELFENQDPLWRDKFFQMAFIENDLAKMNIRDLERILLEARDAVHQRS